VVFDGTPDMLTHEALTAIYGAEDWDAMRKGAEDDEAAERDTARRMAAIV
jgi:phosphonate transport system ATP-binding protein